MDLSMEAHVDEADLIRRARQGDEAAWELLVRDHGQAIFRLAYLLLGDAAEAEDVVQDAFLRAFRSLGHFDEARPLRPWLMRIAANLARNRRRSLGRYLQALGRLMGLAPEPVDAIGEPGTRRWEAETLWQAVRRLNHADQEVIALRYFLELSEAEAAAALGVAPGTIKSRLSRAMARLRVVIDRDYPGLREGRAS